MRNPSFALGSVVRRLTFSVLALGWFSAHAASRTTEHWQASWACSPQAVEPQNRPPDPGLAGNTLRQVVHLTVGGKRVRLRFFNEFGSQPMTVDAVHVALAVASTASPVKGAPGSGAEAVIPATGAIQTATDRTVTFGGKSSATLQPGAPLLSDPVDLPVIAFADLAVTITFGDMPEQITGHPGSRATSFLARGNQVASGTLSQPVSTDHWYVLDGVDVTTDTGGVVVALGDSITDGRGSVTNGNTRWSDFFARRLAANKRTRTASVVDEGIGGNCILHGGLGPTALARFDRDVLAQTGVRWVFLFEGVNDIGGAFRSGAPKQTPPVSDEIILALQQFVARAHSHGIRAYGATITAFGGSSYGTPMAETERARVNEWIRTSGELDGFADFDKASRDPDRPDRLDPAADSGDHLHLSSEGYRRLAASIDLNLFVR